MADKTTTLKTKTNDNVYPNVIGDNRDNAISDSAHINHTLTADHKINFRLDTNVSGLIFNSLQKPAGLTKTKLVGVGTNGQENIEIGDNLTLANGKLSATGGSSGGEGGISVIELTDNNGTIASTQLSEINVNPQNFAFKYNGKILLFTSADSTTYKYCNNTTSSSDNNVMTTSTLLTITLSTGAYIIAENVHNVVANSIHPANGGDLTNIQVGSKVYSIPSGGGGGGLTNKLFQHSLHIESRSNGEYWVEFTLLTATPDKFTTIKAIHDYMIEVYGERFHIAGYIWDTVKGANGVYISPYVASDSSISISMFYQRTEDNSIGSSIINVYDNNSTITDKVFKLI